MAKLRTYPLKNSTSTSNTNSTRTGTSSCSTSSIHTNLVRKRHCSTEFPSFPMNKGSFLPSILEQEMEREPLINTEIDHVIQTKPRAPTTSLNSLTSTYFPPYDPTTLIWNESRTFNTQGFYCYCGHDRHLHRSMLQCHHCLNWFHVDCLKLHGPSSRGMLPFVTTYCFLCFPCASSTSSFSNLYVQEEQLVFSPPQWIEITLTSLANLMLKEFSQVYPVTSSASFLNHQPWPSFYFLRDDVVQFIESNWEALHPGCSSSQNGFDWHVCQANVGKVLCDHPDLFSAKTNIRFVLSPFTLSNPNLFHIKPTPRVAASLGSPWQPRPSSQLNPSKPSGNIGPPCPSLPTFHLELHPMPPLLATPSTLPLPHSSLPTSISTVSSSFSSSSSSSSSSHLQQQNSTTVFIGGPHPTFLPSPTATPPTHFLTHLHPPPSTPSLATPFGFHHALKSNSTSTSTSLSTSTSTTSPLSTSLTSTHHSLPNLFGHVPWLPSLSRPSTPLIHGLPYTSFPYTYALAELNPGFHFTPYRQAEPVHPSIVLSNEDRHSSFHVSATGLSGWCDQGHRAVRASVGVPSRSPPLPSPLPKTTTTTTTTTTSPSTSSLWPRGSQAGGWYYELFMDRPRTASGHVRVGLGTLFAELNGSVGSDGHGLAYLSTGDLVHHGLVRSYGRPIQVGDVVGVEMKVLENWHVVKTLLHQERSETLPSLSPSPSPPFIFLSSNLASCTHTSQWVRVQGHVYLETQWHPHFTDMQPKSLQATFETDHAETDQGGRFMQVSFFINGLSQGPVFMYTPFTVYPMVSCFRGGQVTVNFGPQFRFPPSSLQVTTLDAPIQPYIDMYFEQHTELCLEDLINEVVRWDQHTSKHMAMTSGSPSPSSSSESNSSTAFTSSSSSASVSKAEGHWKQVRVKWALHEQL
ncbi:hypothetical protein HMI54_001342 [Coelomomyces lativittatus]|nr:hypothetical protein HMI56_001272 [Coelomomyces lativittatus]KAJ1506702.1 hypothetical protein HMI55_001065 [Coelomomyces lativittatus]KAJ1510790.1 hypothetical protein HMI54_001342 [Coelomomyces lativittatus]